MKETITFEYYKYFERYNIILEWTMFVVCNWVYSGKSAVINIFGQDPILTP